MANVIVKRGEVTRFIVDTTWVRPYIGKPRTGNRMTTMRLNDQRRWTHLYRLDAEKKALEHAKKHRVSTFLQSVHHVLMYMSEANRRLP